MKSKDLVIDIKKQKLTAGIKGQDPIIAVRPLIPDLPPHCPGADR